MDIPLVLERLCNGADHGPMAHSLGCTYYDLLNTWRDKNVECPTFEAMQACWAQIRDEQAAVAYKAKRAAEYPAMGDQLDAVWKLIQNSADPTGLAVLAQVNAVKARYPKPGGQQA